MGDIGSATQFVGFNRQQLEEEITRLTVSRDGWRAVSQRDNANRDYWRTRAEAAEAEALEDEITSLRASRLAAIVGRLKSGGELQMMAKRNNTLIAERDRLREALTQIAARRFSLADEPSAFESFDFDEVLDIADAALKGQDDEPD